MKAVVYDRPRSFTVTEVPTPEPRAHEVLVRVLRPGVCGTDLHLHDGQFLAAFPLTPGHEVVGAVASVGEGVDAVRVGEQVTVNPNSSCGRCDFCRAGRPILCPHLTGMGSNRPGAFAEYVLAPTRQVFSVEGMPADTALFVEPASCIMHGVDTIAARPGSTALVLGAGPSGLLLAQLIRGSGVTGHDGGAYRLQARPRTGLGRRRNNGDGSWRSRG